MSTPKQTEAPGQNPAVMFDLMSAKRIEDSVRFTESRNRGYSPKTTPPPRGTARVLAWAQTGSGGIGAAASSTVFTGGTVTLYTRVGGTITLGSDTVTAYNCDPSNAVGASKNIIIGYVDGEWDVIFELC